MTELIDNHLTALRAFIATSAFNAYYGFEVASAGAGNAELVMPWRQEAGQYFGFLHAGLIGALIDTTCGCAAGTVVSGRILASHFSANCLRPAVGERFVARARVVRAGRTQVFAAAEVFAVLNNSETLVANGEAIFSVLSEATEA